MARGVPHGCDLGIYQGELGLRFELEPWVGCVLSALGGWFGNLSLKLPARPPHPTA